MSVGLFVYHTHAVPEEVRRWRYILWHWSLQQVCPPCGLWALNPTPLEEQLVLSTAEASLRPHKEKLLRKGVCVSTAEGVLTRTPEARHPASKLLNGDTLTEIRQLSRYRSQFKFYLYTKIYYNGKAYYDLQLYISNYKYFHKSILIYRRSYV